MDLKEIKFYLKFHKGFRKNYTLNSALKSNLLQWNRTKQTIKKDKIMNMKEAVVSVLTNWNNFSGRACRSEFWYFVLATFLVSMIISIIEIATGMVDIESAEMGILSIIFTLLLFVPSLSVTARRLQDRGWSGWWQLLYLTIVGILVIIVLNILPAKEDENKWGRNPLL